MCFVQSLSTLFPDLEHLALKEEESKSKTLQKGAPFKLNLHPRDHFDDNPFHADKCKSSEICVPCVYVCVPGV